MRQKYLFFIIAAFSLVNVHLADTVTTKGGSELNGTITLIDKGTIHLDTKYAGKLKLKQTEVASFETESPFVLRLNNGITVPGKVIPAKDGMLEIKAGDNAINTATAEIKTGWMSGQTDPEIERNRRKWKNDFAFDLNGRTGNVDRYNLGIELDFRLKSQKDELYFGFDYEQGEENGNKTQDRAMGQISYEQFREKKIGWFVLNTLETDPINSVYFRYTVSSGASYRLINKENHTLVTRNGLGYRFTEFEDQSSENESTPTFESKLLHTLTLNDWLNLENELYYSPSISDFSNYNLAHESSLRIPVGNKEKFWIRIGIRNEYETENTAEEKLDTNYYTQLIYSWQ